MGATTRDRALCIGCGDPIMKRDATDVAKALHAVGYADVDLLTGNKATQRNMQNRLAALLNDAPADCTIILFCSCHATYDPDGTLWLRPHSHGPSSSSMEGLNASEIRTACLKSMANVLVILDCCYSGAIASNNLGKLSRRWRTGPGRIFLTSSSKHDLTFYSQFSRNSALTAAVLKCLRSSNNSCRVLAQEVKAYFTERPYWGSSVWAEERGDDFWLCRTDGEPATEEPEGKGIQDEMTVVANNSPSPI